MGVARVGCSNTRGRRIAYWRPFGQFCSSVVAIVATNLSSMCRDLHSPDGVLIQRRYRASGIALSTRTVGSRTTQSRFNCTLRQRVSRLVRKSLSFSKKLDNHIAAIWNFVHDYNDKLRHKRPATSYSASISLSFP